MYRQAHDIVTAVCFSPDGVYVIVGLLDGRVYIYETTDMKYYTVIAYKKKKITGAVRSRKITGVRCVSRGALPSEPGLRRAALTKDKYFILVTSNDCRIRLFTMTDFTLVAKFHGASNFSMQIRADASVDGKRIICGSDTGNVYMWLTPSRRVGGDEGTGGDDGYMRSLYDTKHRNVYKYSILTTDKKVSSSHEGLQAGARPSPCVAALFVPLHAVHHARMASSQLESSLAGDYGQQSDLQSHSVASVDLDKEDVSSLVILSAYADGCIKFFHVSNL